jgi:hypothetical protein
MPVAEHEGDVAYTLAVGDQRIGLNQFLGTGLAISYAGRIECCHCGADTPRSYSGGYCYTCFKTLAQTDLCVVSPDRCHFDKGTCRDPEWAQGFCMQPHVVYLACSSGPKVGITRKGREITRWIDQGASKAIVLYQTISRHLAGVVEVMIAARLSDRTDWRRMLIEEGESVDLGGHIQQIRSLLNLPEGVSEMRGEEIAFKYPGDPASLSSAVLKNRFVLSSDLPRIEGRLHAIKGQFLIFDHGVFNVRQHQSFDVVVESIAMENLNPTPRPDTQMELF